MKTIYETVYREYLSALLEGDRISCTAGVRQARESEITIKNVYEQLFQRSLYKVGELWEYNKISVAVEHMATSITEGLMNQLYAETISLKRVDKKMIITSVENELHQVGGRMVADVFEMNGWDSFYLGADTPAVELMRFIRRVNPDLVGLSLNLFYNIRNLEKMIKCIRDEFGLLPILIGGQAFRFGGASVTGIYPAVTYISSLDELERFIIKEAS